MGRTRSLFAALALACALVSIAIEQSALAFEYGGVDWTIGEQDGEYFMVSSSETLRIRPGRITVRFDELLSHDGAVAIIESLSGASLIRHSRAGWFDLELSADDPTDPLEDLQTRPSVVDAVPAILGEFCTGPDDDDFYRQWALRNTGTTGGTSDADIDATDAWEVETGDTTVIVALLDSGIPFDHEDLEASIWFNWDEGSAVDSDDDDSNGFDDDFMGWDFYDDDRDPSFPVDETVYHGSQMAGVAGAKTNNAKGIAGLAGGWGTDRSTGCKLMILRIGKNGTPDMTVVEDAIEYAVDNGASVINMSFSSASLEDTVQMGMRSAIQDAWEEGVLLVGAVGNYNGDPVRYPAKFDEVMAIGGTDHDDVFWAVSNKGDELNFSAPSGSWVMPDTQAQILPAQIYTTLNGSASYGYRVGTSQSTALVSASAALALSAAPITSNEDLWRALEFSADDEVGDADGGWQDDYGWGRLNVDRLLAALDYRINSRYNYSNATCKVFCPGGDADTFSIDVTMKDGEGDPVEGVPAGAIWAQSKSRAFKICCADEDTPDCVIAYSERVFADAPTDSVGKTTISLTHGGGSYNGSPVRLVYVHGVPIAAYGLMSVDPFTSYDLNVDCNVDAADSTFLAGLSSRDYRGDFDCDGTIDQDDFDLLALHREHECGSRFEYGEVHAAEGYNGGLLHVYPNPVGPSSTVRYFVPADGTRVELSVYSAAGRLVKTLVSSPRENGWHEALWDGTSTTRERVASGVYFYRARIGREVVAKKVVIIR